MKHRLQKPVRCMLDRDEDMLITGTRHPFLFKYKVGFNNAGLIKVAKVHIYNNAGNSHDLSVSVSNNIMDSRDLVFIKNFIYHNVCMKENYRFKYF